MFVFIYLLWPDACDFAPDDGSSETTFHKTLNLARSCSPFCNLTSNHHLPMTSTAQRLTQFAAQTLGTSGKARVLAQSDNDVVIVAALRTPITKVNYLQQFESIEQ
jgi:hypothetical protein